jgi:type II secretory pathway pseudopilin PulG
MPDTLILQKDRRLQHTSSRSIQQGATLAEVAIIIGVLAVLATLIVSSFSGDGTKATVLIQNMRTLSDGMLRAKADIGCFPNQPTVLWRQAQAVAANTFCGIDGVQTWNGPYLSSQPIDSGTGAILMPAVGGDVAATIAREATPDDGLGWYYYIRAEHVPNPVIIAALQKCNGGKDAAATFETGTCRGALGSGSAELGTFDMKTEESY